MLVEGITSHIPDVVRNGDPERNYPGDASCLCGAHPIFPSHSAVVLPFLLIFVYYSRIYIYNSVYVFVCLLVCLFMVNAKTTAQIDAKHSTNIVRFLVFLSHTTPIFTYLISLPLSVPVGQLSVIKIADIRSAFIETLVSEHFHRNAIDGVP